MLRSFLFFIGAAALVLPFSQVAEADVIASFQVPFYTALNNCGGPICSLQLAPDTFFSFDITSYDDQCSHYICGPIEAGTISYTSPTFSMEGNLVPGPNSIFYTLADVGGDSSCASPQFIIFNWTADIDITQVNGMAGTGQGTTGGNTVDACNGPIPVADVSIGISVASFIPAAVPEPGSFILLGSGLLPLLFILKRQASPERAGIDSST